MKKFCSLLIPGLVALPCTTHAELAVAVLGRGPVKVPLRYLETRLRLAAQTLIQTEHVIIGGGAGLSDAAGLRYTGEDFTENFAPFIERYGFKDLYSSSFHPFQTQEEKWAYWAKHISVCRYEVPAMELYKDLLHLVRGKEFFVLTTNVDAQFQKAGFPQDTIFAVQGDYGYFQCARRCHDGLYSNEREVAEMVHRTVDCKIPSKLVPVCPVCHGPMDVYVHKDQYFVRDRHWKESDSRYSEFLRSCTGKKLALLELGVGFNTPGIIRFPFEELVHANPNAALIRFNRDYPHATHENAKRTISFAEDMTALVRGLIERQDSPIFQSGQCPLTCNM